MQQSAPLRLVLASSSPARRDLLARAGHDFDVVPAHIDEPTGAGAADPRAFVQQVAWLKAAAVAARIERGLVLAADTVGWLQGRIIGKPVDEIDARRILRMLGGNVHELWTGVVLWRRPDNWQLAWQERSLVSFQRMTEGELQEYLATRSWQGCSGAYAILEKDDPYVSLVEGSLSNVIGLPMETLEKALPWFGSAPSQP
jgi:nucleoside triphosphate pyrophosphatase